MEDRRYAKLEAQVSKLKEEVKTLRSQMAHMQKEIDKLQTIEET